MSKYSRQTGSSSEIRTPPLNSPWVSILKAFVAEELKIFEMLTS